MQKTILFSIVACACMCAVGAVVFAAEGTAPPVKVYPAVPRRAYLAGERIDLVVVLGDGAAGELAIFLDDGRSAGVVARQAVERPGTLTFAVDSTYLKSGTYTIGARLGEAEVRWSERDKPIQLTLISNQPATNLSMVSFGQGFTREEMFTPSKVADLGYNLRMMERERPKTPQQGRPRVGIPRLLPHEQEVDDYLALGIRAHVANTVHWGLAHQVIRRGGCYNDPALIQFALQEMTIAAQHIRQFPSLEGASSGDELALTWTPNKAGNFDTVGSCRICRAAFEAKAGRPAPAREEAGNDEALWAQWMRWRSDTWTDFMTAVGRELKAVAPEKLWMADVYAPTAFGDGVYPTQATAGDGLFTHHYSIWEAAGQGVVPMACELQRAGCNWEMPFWPMVSAWLLQDLEPQLHRHMLNLAISRKIDGIGTWGPLGGQAGEAVIKEEMGKLARYGDFYKALKRRRGDVAVLYSFTEMAHLLGGTFEDSYARNENRLAHVLPFAEAFLTSYRAHYNTSVILEEEILAGDLKYCKVLLVPAAPHLPKNVTAAIERYIEAGGAAFVEKSSPLAIKGARRLSMDFSTLTEARKKTAEAYAAEKQRNEGKTDEESVYEAWKLESDVV
ncbi:MAG TPA: hypothetical protein VM223_01005, partial [Planctomycetota bacterium]|nr:hypothetical protein [Planctomycetota bacterium]